MSQQQFTKDENMQETTNNEVKLQNPAANSSNEDLSNKNPDSAAAEKLSDTWAADSQDELEDWIEEQGIQLRY